MRTMRGDRDCFESVSLVVEGCCSRGFCGVEDGSLACIVLEMDEFASLRRRKEFSCRNGKTGKTIS